MNVILSIAGSDSSGGAGIQADIKSSQYHNVFCSTAITAVTAQNTVGVQEVKFLEPSFIKAQIDSVLNDLDVKAIKIGMLGTVEIIEAVKSSLDNVNIPIILDPVAVSRTGFKLIDDNAINSLKRLFPKALLITPNYYEAKEFFDVSSIEDVLMSDNYGTNILFKNIDRDNELCVDVLKKGDNKHDYFQTPKVDTKNTHGTGCSFSASIAALIANGYNLNEAIEESKKYIYEAIKTAPNIGKGNGPINHTLKV